MQGENKRCPLQTECERRCRHTGRELECDYYRNNAREELVIEDQEELRAEEECRAAVETLERELAEMDEDCEAEESASGLPQAQTGKLVWLPVEQLHPHPDNPRKALGDLQELVDSIRANGIYQNLTVVQDGPERYTVVIGHRRLAASVQAGLAHVPCVVAEMTPREQVQTMLLENMQRSDLTVYEQAQGFQMMLDMGSTVEEIAEKTGFSRTTVRRRVKMMELDQVILKEVSDRQLSLADFDKLAKIEDLSARNECLKLIGTKNFELEAERRLKAQRIAENLKIIKPGLRRSRAKKIQQHETWNGNYEELRDAAVDLSSYEGASFEAPSVAGELYYCLQEDIGRLRFYGKKKKAAPIRRTEAEIRREKQILAAHEVLEELDGLARKMRAAYVSGLTVTAQNRERMLRGAVSAMIAQGFKYGGASGTELCRLAGMTRAWAAGENERCAALLLENLKKLAPAVIYEAFADRNEYYYTRYKGAWPTHEKNLRLDLLYDWLISLGYDMSDEERELRDGTHAMLRDPEKERDDAQGL